MAEPPSIGDPHASNKTTFVVHEHHIQPQDHDPSLRTSGKRERDEFGDGNLMLHHNEVEQDEDGLKKSKIVEGLADLDDDALLDDLKPVQLVVGGLDGVGSMHGLGMGIQYFASTGNIKSPIFEGIPSLTPEWLLKKVWLKVNGDIDQTVLASLISKDMGPKLRQEIRSFLEKRGEIQTGNRINLKNTIMQAVEITITCQKEKPTLAIVREMNKQRPKKEGKQEKNFNIGLTPYGQSVCMAELQLKKRDSFTQRSPTKMGLNLGMSMGMSLGDSTGLSPLAMNLAVVPNAPPPHLPLGVQPMHTQHLALAMNMGWKPNVKEMNDELLKRNVQVGDLSGQLINMKDEVQIMKEECHKKDIIIAELRNIIMDLKPSYTFPAHLLPGDGVNMMDPSHAHHHAHHQHVHPHAHQHQHSHPHVHTHPHLQMHQAGEHGMMHLVDHPNIMSEAMMTQAVGDPQSFMPQ